MNLETILADEQLFEAFLEEEGGTFNDFKETIESLYPEWKEHNHEICKCYLCR